MAHPEVARQFVILDARSRTSYEQGRVPGARWVDVGAWQKAFGDGKDAEGWGKRIGERGIGPDSKVLVYDDVKDAARVWWILRYWGVEDVRLMNGGWTGWQAAKLPLETGPPQAAATDEFAATARSKRLSTKQQLLDALKDKALQIIDARSEGEFCGIEKLANKRGGAVPGAKHLEWLDLIDKETRRFKPPEELRRLFQAAGIDPKRPTSTYCQSGGRAAVMAFALELMGADDVRNYYASWAEWGNADDTPVDVPASPPPAAHDQ